MLFRRVEVFSGAEVFFRHGGLSFNCEALGAPSFLGGLRGLFLCVKNYLYFDVVLES